MANYHYDQPISSIATVLIQQIKNNPKSFINFYWISKEDITFNFSFDFDSAALFSLPMTSYLFQGGNQEAIIDVLKCLISYIIPKLMKKKGGQNEN